MGTYRQCKEALENQLVRLTQFPELQGSSLVQILDKLRENRFNLVILGAFKRGKSTLINALLGEPILPTSIVPLTSVVTVLGYGEHLNIEVLFQNGDGKRSPGRNCWNTSPRKVTPAIGRGSEKSISPTLPIT